MSGKWIKAERRWCYGKCHPDTLVIFRNLKKYRAACALIRQACINKGSWPVWQRGTFWLVRVGDWGYDESHNNTPLEIAPGVQVYGEG